jgi:hypothetical protein
VNHVLTNQRKIRDQRGQLLTLLNGWDPAGLLHAGAARDEYGPIVDQLLDLLSQTPSEAEVTRFLQQQVTEHFGTAPADASRFAAKAVTWYRLLPQDE